MTKNLLLIFFGFCMALVGFYAQSYFILYIDMNDRLKHEASYARGYFDIVSALEENEYDKAKLISQGRLDAHLLTLSEYGFLNNSIIWPEINESLCSIAASKISHSHGLPIQMKQEIDSFLNKIKADC